MLEYGRLEHLRLEVYRSDSVHLGPLLSALEARMAHLRIRLAEASARLEGASAEPQAMRDAQMQRQCWSILLIKSLCVLADVHALAPPGHRLDWAREADALATELGTPRERTLARLVLMELLAELGSVTEAYELAIAYLEGRTFVDEEARRGFEVAVAGIERRARLYEAAMERGARVSAELEALPYDSDKDPVRIDEELVLHGILGSCLRDLGIVDRAALELSAMEGCMERLLDRDEVPILSLRSAILHLGALLQAYERHEEILSFAEKWMANPVVSGSSESARWELRLLQAFAHADLEREDPARPKRASEDLASLHAEPHGTLSSRRTLEGVLAASLLDAGHIVEARALLEGLRATYGPADPADAGASDQFLAESALRARLAVAESAGHDVLEACLRELREACASFLESFAEVPMRAGGVGFLYFGSRRGWLCDLVRLAIATKGPEEGAKLAFEDLLPAQCIGALALSLGARPGTLAEARAALCTEKDGLLFFLPGPEHSHLFALDARVLIHAELPREGELQPSLAEHFQLFGEILIAPAGERERLVERERAIARRLSDVFFPREIDALLTSWESVTIVGADLLGDAALEFLPAAGGEYLGLERAVAYLPSIPVGVALAERERRRGAPALDLLLVAAPQQTASELELAPLVLDPADEEALISSYAPERRRVLARERAACETLFGEDLGGVSVLQFLVHGARDPARERPAVLALQSTTTDRGLLGSEEVESHLDGGAVSLEAPALVVLTACATARGPWRPGDDLSGHLGGAWLRAGARAVCLSPTELLLGSTLDLSGRLHMHLARGLSPAGALQHARRDLLDTGGPAALYGAGPLRMIGLAQGGLFQPPPPVDHEQSTRAIPWTIGIALVIAAILAAMAVRRTRERATAR